MPGGSSQTSSQKTSSAPWGPSQDYLKGGMADAQKLLDSGSGFKYYGTGDPNKKGWTDFSSQTQNALNTQQNLASQPNQFYSGMANFNNGLINGNYNLDQSGYQGLMGQGPNTEGDYRNLMNGVNSSFEQTVQNTANDLGDQIQRQFGGASYGSPENADYLTKGVGDVVSKMRSDNFYNNQNLQRGLLGDITGVQQQNFDNTRGLLGDMTNIQQSDINNRLAGLNQADSTYASQYLPSQYMANVGAQYDAKNNEILASKMDKWNTNKMSDWDRLTQAMGIFSGTGSQGNRTTTSTSQPTDIFSKLLGGGLLASQIFDR